MTFTRAPYEIAAPALIAELDQIADRFAPEHDDALETLSVLNSVRDADAHGAPLVYAGQHRFVASTGIAIVVVDSIDLARRYVANVSHRFPRGRAIVEVDFTGAEPVFTRHALEAPRLETSAGGIVFAALAEIAAEEAAEAADAEADDLLRPGYVDDERELAAAELGDDFANADDFDVDFDPPEDDDVVETITAPVADPAELEGTEAEIYARAIAAGIPADQLFAFEGEIWHRGAPLFLDDLPPLPPAPVVRDRTHERADLALERLTDLGHADVAVRILRSWDAGRLTAAQALEKANAAEREIAWQRIRSRSGARSRPAPR